MTMRRIALLMMTVFAVAACSSHTVPTYHEDTYPITPGHEYPHVVTIGHGRYAAATWSLRAFVDAEGQLCMGVRWRPRSPGQDDGCGFGSNTVNDYGRMTEPVDTSNSSLGFWLAYGPSPVHAVRATLTMPNVGRACRRWQLPRTTVRITHRLPSWYPRHGAGWFVAPITRAASDCVIDVRFTDLRGRTVRQPNDF